MTFFAEFRRTWLIATIGCVLFLAGSGMLVWNEGRALHTTLSLDEALEDAITLNPEDDINSKYEGRIVHITGPIIVGEPLTEPDYNIQILSVKLKRKVQMYQWVEETVEHNFGGSVASFEADNRNYYYTTEWRDRLIDSRHFYMQTGHHNPEKFPIESQTQVADMVNIGKYELGDEVKQKINNFIELTSDQRPDDPSIKLHLGLYYHSNDIFNPEVGDVRILFSFAGLEGQMYTIVGKLQNGVIVPYETSRGLKILLVYRGEMRLADVFKQEHHSHRLTTWSFRFMGWALLFFAATCTAGLIHIILSRFSLLAPMAPDPHYPTSTNILLSISMAVSITAIAWVAHRPWYGGGLLLAAAAPFLNSARSVAVAARYELLNANSIR